MPRILVQKSERKAFWTGGLRGAARYEWSDAVRRDFGVSATDYLIASNLCSHCNKDTGCIWLSYRTIAAETGYAVRSVRDAVQRLLERGWIDVGYRPLPGGGVDPNHVFRLVRRQAPPGEAAINVRQKQKAKGKSAAPVPSSPQAEIRLSGEESPEAEIRLPAPNHIPGVQTGLSAIQKASEVGHFSVGGVPDFDQSREAEIRPYGNVAENLVSVTKVTSRLIKTPGRDDETAPAAPIVSTGCGDHLQDEGEKEQTLPVDALSAPAAPAGLRPDVVHIPGMSAKKAMEMKATLPAENPAAFPSAGAGAAARAAAGVPPVAPAEQRIDGLSDVDYAELQGRLTSAGRMQHDRIDRDFRAEISRRDEIAAMCQSYGINAPTAPAVPAAPELPPGLASATDNEVDPNLEAELMAMVA